jgi:ferredoxin-NADP reductase
MASIPLCYYYYYLRPSSSFEKIKITSIQNESSNTLRIGLSKRIGDRVPFHIIVKDDSCEIGREYSPVTIGEDTFLIVKIYPHGTLSNLFSKLRVNDSISCSRTISTYDLGEDDVGLVCGGTGITPCFQILRHTLLNTNKNVSLFYINKTPNDILLKKELEELAAEYPLRFKLDLAVNSYNGKDDKKFSRGFENLDPNPDKPVIVCGPEGFSEYLCKDKLPSMGIKDIVRLKS